MKTSVQYIAGFFDREGMISIHKKRLKPGLTKRGHIFNTVISFSNLNYNVLKQIQETLGYGRFYVTSKIDSRHKRPIYQLRIGNQREIIEVLKKLYPFLIVKKNLADLMLVFCRSRIRRKRRPYNASEVEIYKKVRALNGNRRHKYFDSPTSILRCPVEEVKRRRLKRLYLIDRKSIRQIAKELKFSASTIWRLLKKYRIPRRTNSEGKKAAFILNPPFRGLGGRFVGRSSGLND